MSFTPFYVFQDGLNKSHVENMMSASVAVLTCLMDITLLSPMVFQMTTCLSDLNSTIFQSPKNFGSRPYAW